MSKTVNLKLKEQEAGFILNLLKQFSSGSRNKAKHLKVYAGFESGEVLNKEEREKFEKSQKEQKEFAEVLLKLSDISDNISNNLTFEMVKNKIKLKK